MKTEQPFYIYQEQLSSIYHWHGLALWNQIPSLFGPVSIGDVGYVNEGAFIRMFNVTLPCDDQSNKTLGEPFHYDPLSPDSFSIRTENFGRTDYYSRGVSREESEDNIYAKTLDQAGGITYACRGHGALLSLPCGGIRQVVIQMKVFEKYAEEHKASWFHWSKARGLPVERMEDLVLIYGCTLVSSWAAVAFNDFATGARVSFASRALENDGAVFEWSNMYGTVEHHDSQLDTRIPYAPRNHCVFVKCIRSESDKFWAKLFRQPSLSLAGNKGFRNTLSSLGNGTNFGGSSSILDTIVPINRENPQLLPYPSSITLQSNGSVYDASFITSPSYDSLIEGMNDIAEVPHEDAFSEDTTSNNDDDDPSVH